MQGLREGRASLLALLVDDDIAYLEVLKFFLEREGAMECELATSAKQAIEMLQQKEFDAVVSDYLMPEMDGLELLKIIRLQGKEIPFIMLTGRGREDVAMDALNSGADYYIQKGGDPKAQYTDLSNMIRKSASQRRAERRIVDDERFMSMLLESVQDGVCVVGKDMVIEKVNPAMGRWFADSTPLVGKRCYEVLRNRHDSCDNCPSRGVMRSGRVGSERVLKHGQNGGPEKWFEVFSVPFFNPATGEVERVVEYIRDVTEQESARNALESSERRSRAVTELTSDGVFAIEPEGEISYVNASLARMLGYERADDIVGMQVSALVSPECQRTMGPGMLHRLLEDGARVEMTLARKDGSNLRAVVSAAPISSEHGLSEGAVAVVTVPSGRSPGPEVSPSAFINASEPNEDKDPGKMVLDSIPVGVIITDPNGRIISLNAALREMMGWLDAADLVDVSVFSFLGKEEAARTRHAFQKLAAEGSISEIPFQVVRKDGIRIRVEVSASVLRDKAGEPLYFVGAVRDTTDQARYQASLEEALEDRRQMEAIVDDSPAVAFRWLDKPGWPVDYVSANVRSFGYEAADLTSGVIPFVSIVHPDDRDRVVREADSRIEQGMTEFEQEYRIVSPEGQVFWVYDRTKVLRRSDGTLEACQGIVVDITEMKDALDRLSRTEKQLKLFMDMSPVIKFLKDTSGRYLYVNKHFLGVFGGTAEDWTGKRDADMFPQEAAGRFMESDRAVLEQGQLICTHEVAPLPDGPHEYLTYKFLVPSITGADDLIAGIVIDETDEKRYERALSAANDKLNLLGSMNRHDIMNQLAVLTGWLDVVGEGLDDPVKLRRIEAMRKASAAIQKLLVFASDYQDIGSKQPVWVGVGQAASDGMASLQMDPVRVEVDVPGLEVYADQLLERVFWNLFDNSLRHGKKVTRVGLSSRRDDGGLVIVYEDDGVGVPDELKSRIFERGFGKHTGLGLFLARQVLSLTGITIEETGKEGKGARFEMRVPEGGFRFSSGKG